MDKWQLARINIRWDIRMGVIKVKSIHWYAAAVLAGAVGVTCAVPSGRDDLPKIEIPASDLRPDQLLKNSEGPYNLGTVYIGERMPTSFKFLDETRYFGTMIGSGPNNGFFYGVLPKQGAWKLGKATTVVVPGLDPHKVPYVDANSKTIYLGQKADKLDLKENQKIDIGKLSWNISFGYPEGMNRSPFEIDKFEVAAKRRTTVEVNFRKKGLRVFYGRLLHSSPSLDISSVGGLEDRVGEGFKEGVERIRRNWAGEPVAHYSIGIAIPSKKGRARRWFERYEKERIERLKGGGNNARKNMTPRSEK
jgi:hypothetical protein